MIAEIKEPKSTKVLGLLAAPSWTPRPSDLPPWKLDTMGLMMLVVKAVIRPLKAKATTSPTATTITSPRMRKFLKPFMPFPPIHNHERPPGWQVRCLTIGRPVARPPGQNSHRARLLAGKCRDLCCPPIVTPSGLPHPGYGPHLA